MIERMTAAELNAMNEKPKGKQRAGGDNAQRVEYMGEMFDSKHEAMRWRDLNLMQRAGIITDLKRQVRIDLIGRDGPILTPTGRVMHYKADFVYISGSTGLKVVEDAKGHASDIFKMKKAILAAMGINVIEV